MELLEHSSNRSRCNASAIWLFFSPLILVERMLNHNLDHIVECVVSDRQKKKQVAKTRNSYHEKLFYNYA